MTTGEKAIEGRKCEGCGARVRREAPFCEYCGAELPRAAPALSAPPSSHQDLAARFAALKAHPAYADLLRRRPSALGAISSAVAPMLVGLLFAGISAVFVFHTSPFPSGASGTFDLVPALFGLIGLGIAIWSFSRLLGLSGPPLKRLPALVVGERASLADGSGDTVGGAGYHVTLQYENGFRREYRTDGAVVGLIGKGDVGVGYVKGNWLLAFAVVRV